MTTPNPDIWHGAYKLPWHDPEFSQRMLAEHLAQTHDMASRRTTWIDQQVAWIHTTLLNERPARILDLGCGPGFYATRLTACGHRCRGIDIGPASIAYAQQHNPDPARCEFVQGDIRQAAFGGPYDLAMILFGEFNVFAPDEIRTILRHAHAALAPAGLLICELQTPAAVEGTGRGPASDTHSESGLFSPRPHRWQTENRWLPEQRVAVQTFTITEDGTAAPRVYRSTSQAWPDNDLKDLFHEAGFTATERCQTWPGNTAALVLWAAHCV